MFFILVRIQKDANGLEVVTWRIITAYSAASEDDNHISQATWSSTTDNISQ